MTANISTIWVNGRETPCEKGLSLVDYVRGVRQKMELSPETPLVVELNGQIIPAEKIDGHPLQNGDRLELIHFVGGG